MINVILNLIVAAAAAHMVSTQQMINISCNESGFDRHAQNGQYVGLNQLGFGMQQQFYARGYTDLYDPAQQSNFLAEKLAAGGQSNWLQTIYVPCRLL